MIYQEKENKDHNIYLNKLNFKHCNNSDQNNDFSTIKDPIHKDMCP